MQEICRPLVEQAFLHFLKNGKKLRKAQFTLCPTFLRLLAKPGPSQIQAQCDPNYFASNANTNEFGQTSEPLPEEDYSL